MSYFVRLYFRNIKYINFNIYICGQIMSTTENKLQLVEADSHQESFFLPRDQTADTPPAQLSGQQQGEQSVFVSSLQTAKSSFALTVIMIVKTVIGSAILGLPFAVSKCGYIFVVIVLFFATSATQFSADLLLKAKNLSGHSNYSTILYHIYNHKFSKAIGSLLIFLNNLGTCKEYSYIGIAEIIIFKRTIRQNIFQTTLKGDSILDEFYFSEYMIVIVIALMEIPFTLVKKIERLRFMALLGVVGTIVFIITFVCYYAITVTKKDAIIQEMNMFPSDWFSAAAAIPNILMAFSYQMNFFPIFKGMKNTNDHKMKMASLAGVGICAFCYLLIGILGYSLVGSTVQGNFLLSIDYESSNKVIYYFINGGFLISVFVAFPIMFFGCRNNFIALIKLAMAKTTVRGENSKSQLYIDNEERTQQKKKDSFMFYVYSFIIYLIIIGVGISVEDVESVFNLVGAVCSSSIGMLLPAYFYFMLVIKKKTAKSTIFYAAIGMFIIMVPFAIFAVVAQYVHL